MSSIRINDPVTSPVIAAPSSQPQPPLALLERESDPVRKRKREKFIRFAVCVIIPTILATVYYGFLASDVYVSEARFIIRSAQRQAPAGLSAVFQNSTFGRSQDDSYPVHDFIASRDALKELETRHRVSDHFSDKQVDLLARFGAFDGDKSFEALHRYYQKQISLELDAASSISTLRIKAFSAEASHGINESLLLLSEQLINRLNERGRQDSLKFSTNEVELSQQKAAAATLAVSRFRTSREVFDPERQSMLQLQMVSKLQDELISNESSLAELKAISPSSPQISTLRLRVKNLQRSIADELSKVSGSGKSLVNKAADYEKLVLDRSFAEKQLSAALASLEAARGDAQRKQLYLERIVQPNTPDVAVEPKRLKAIITVLGASLIFWGIISLMIAGAKEHVD